MTSEWEGKKKINPAGKGKGVELNIHIRCTSAYTHEQLPKFKCNSDPFLIGVTLLLRISRIFQHFRFKDTHTHTKKRNKELNWKGVVFLYHPPDKSPSKSHVCTSARIFKSGALIVVFKHGQAPNGGSLRGPIRTYAEDFYATPDLFIVIG